MLMLRRLVIALCLPMAMLWLSGCVAAKFIGGALQNDEYQKLVDMPPKYNGLESKTVAVLVEVDMSTLYDYPDLAATIAGGISGRIQQHVPGAQVLHPNLVLQWQYRTPQWNALPYGELTHQLNVDRIVHIDILEYRLNPPGNRYMWEGLCVGRIGIVERGAIDPDIFSETFDVTVKFPNVSGVDRESASQRAIEAGVLAEFIKKSAWLFYQHVEPKYPDKYRPELETPKKT